MITDQIVGMVTHYNGNLPSSRPVIWTCQGPVDSTIALLDDTPDVQGVAYGINEMDVAVGTISSSFWLPGPA